jgi:polysaccharide pyruvyl transferase WcaK-like protein
MPRRRIGLVGYFGYGNYGDELFLSVYEKYFYDCELIVIPDSPKNPTYGAKFADVAKTVETLDAVIIGGGDLFIPKYYAESYFQEALTKRPIYFHGVGVPLWIGEDPAVVARMAKYVNHPSVRKISVRDAESAAWITEKLKPTVAVEHAADMVFSLNFPKVDRPKDRKVFGVVTRKGTPGKIRWDRITSLCERARFYGYEVHNIVLGTGAIRADDLEGLKEWTYTDMITVDPQNIDELTKAIGRCHVLASTKFHGCVVAAAYGIPAITMTTTDKFVNLYRDMERSDLVSHFLHDDLVTHLSKYMAVIPQVTRSRLRRDAETALDGLRAAILGEI